MPGWLLPSFVLAEFLPQGAAYDYATDILWMSVAADGMIALAFLSIPVGLIYLAQQRRDLPAPWLVYLFALFIGACGVAHLVELVTYWEPWHFLAAIVKLLAALIALPTAVALFPAIAYLMTLRGPGELEELNARLQQEIADRQRAAAELAASTRRIQELYDGAPCGYHSIDASGTFLEINATELAWLGYERDEVIGRMRFSDILTKEGRELFLREFPNYKESGQARELQFDLVCKDGSRLPVLLSSRAQRRPDGTFERSLTTVFDISERIHFEQELQQVNADLEVRVEQRTRELEKANRELSERSHENELFVYSVSHDLRSPLVNLQGFSEELALSCREMKGLLAADPLPPNWRASAATIMERDMGEAIRFIQSSVSTLGRIIESLLRLSRAGRVEYQWQEVPINSIVRQVLDSQSGQIEASGARIEVKPLPAAWGDPTAIGQIFANLVHNAVQYLDLNRPGEIVISAQTDEDGALASGDSRPMRTYAVRDNGRGIAINQRERVFQAFQRLHPGVGQGEGVGLVLVKRIVDRHGGRIWFESQPGVGTTFFVALPADQTALASGKRPS